MEGGDRIAGTTLQPVGYLLNNPRVKGHPHPICCLGNTAEPEEAFIYPLIVLKENTIDLPGGAEGAEGPARHSAQETTGHALGVVHRGGPSSALDANNLAIA